VRRLTKAYRSVAVLAGVDLAVESDASRPCSGPNGAGKTTLVRILATLSERIPGLPVAGFDVAREAGRYAGTSR
jgi:ABC-2 type transport system ATP-binding protein